MCWLAGKAARASEAFVTGWPFSDPGPALLHCRACQDRERGMGIRLVSVPATPEMLGEPSADDLQWSQVNPPEIPKWLADLAEPFDWDDDDGEEWKWGSK
jgi:hypothetical protein